MNIDLLLQQRKTLQNMLHDVTEEIKKHVTTWQGLALCGMTLEAAAAYREEEKKKNPVSNKSLLECVQHIKAWVQSSGQIE